MIEALLGSALRSIGLATFVWLSLKLLRLRNPHIQLTMWTIVLAASLLMPVATQLTAVAIPSARMPIVGDWLPFLAKRPALGRTDDAVSLVVEDQAPTQSGEAPAGWTPMFFASAIYATIAGAYLLRMIAGLLLTWRLVRSATPLHGDRKSVV